MTGCYEYSDRWNRQCLNSLVHHMFQTTPFDADATDLIIDTLEHSIPDINQRTDFVNQMISDIVYPIEVEVDTSEEQDKEFQVSQIKLEINRLKNHLEIAVTEEEFILADELKRKLELEKTKLENITTLNTPKPTKSNKRTDLATTIKSLDIAAAILRSPEVKSLTNSLRSLKDDYIQPLLLHGHPSVEYRAMKCYALCCLIDKTTARTGIHIFSTAIFRYTKGDECDTEVLRLSIMAVTDMLRIYGSQLIAAPPSEQSSESMDENQQVPFDGGSSLTEVLQGMAEMMDNEEDVIQSTAGKALCQLLLFDCIRSPSLTSRLILKWCNPAVGNSLNIIIGHTLQELPKIEDQCKQLKEAVILTMRTIVLAPRTSPFADVDLENAAKFMLALLKTSTLSTYIIRDLGKMLLAEIKRNPRSRVNVILSKMLLFLDVSFDPPTAEELLKLCEDLKMDVGDRQVLNNLLKFSSNLSKDLVEMTSPTGSVNEP